MIIHPVRLTNDGARCQISAEIELETEGRVFTTSQTSRETLWIDWPASYYSPDSADAGPFATICLTLAMCVKERLVIKDTISQALLLNLLEAMEIYATDFPELCEVMDVSVECEHRGRVQRGRVASFYSGGVDSLYNIAECKRLTDRHGTDAVTDLWLIQGMDIKLSDEALWATVKHALNAPYAKSESMKCVDIRTNARDIHDNYVSWEQLGFSAILGGIAKCFAEPVETVLIGSYAKYRDLIPHASSPLIDPLWSCDRQTIRHFSCRADRMQKIATVAEYAPELLPALRVCYKNDGGAYNCGKCEKCLRTQMQLLILGVLDAVPGFAVKLTPDLIRTIWLPWQAKNAYAWTFWEDIEQGCKERGLTDYYAAVKRQLRINRVDRIRKRVRRFFRDLTTA